MPPLSTSRSRGVHPDSEHRAKDPLGRAGLPPPVPTPSPNGSDPTTARQIAPASSAPNAP